MPTTSETLSPKQFARLSEIAGRETGIVLGEHKRVMVQGRIVRRMRDLGLDSFDAYLKVLEAPGTKEIPNFINSITTNVTHFFREPHHFEHLSKDLLPKMLEARKSTRRLRFWSAGCSKGHEPYTLAMTLLAAMPEASWDLKILATDIDLNVLAFCKAGIYEESDLEKVPQQFRKRFFKRVKGKEGSYEVVQQLRDLITFKQLNLMDKQWPMRGPFDSIFCRNVVIYFDKPTQEVLYRRYAGLLEPGGHVFLGHSESMMGVDVPFELTQKSVYRYTGGAR